MTTEDLKKILTLFHIGSFPLNAKEAGDFVYLNNKIVEEVKKQETPKEETKSELYARPIFRTHYKLLARTK